MDYDISAFLWALMTIGGPLVLALILAYGGYQTIRRRSRTRAPVGPRAATPEEAALNERLGQGREKSFGTYALRLGLPVAAALALVAAAAVLYTRIG